MNELSQQKLRLEELATKLIEGVSTFEEDMEFKHLYSLLLSQENK
ncbi:hypothetical protein [Thalassomonas sp. M1454]|nr:hypothetical protein [Thalassomonas sp. M1454]